MSFLDEAQLQVLAKPILASVTQSSTASSVVRLAGGASLRSYYRVSGDGSPSSMLIMETGETGAPGHSDEAVSGATPTEMPFVNVQRYLSKGAAPVPTIYLHDLEHGLLYLEDLGDITFESRVVDSSDSVRRDYYRLAIDILVRMQRWTSAERDESCIAFGRGFDAKLLEWELDHFREYGLDARDLTLAVEARREFDVAAKQIAEEIAGWPRLFVHRDYQSRNLMVQDDPRGPRLRVIDFQDALLGSDVYDLVGLLRDSYVPLSSSLVRELVGYHAAASGHDAAAFARRFYLQTVQRKLKDAGRFVFIEQVKKLPGFMQHIPRTLGYVTEAFDELGDHPAASRLRQALRTVLPTL